MKQQIHPTYYAEAQVTCACGNSFTIGSTKQSLRIDICHKCHPFYTGEMKFVDTLGRVEKFQKRQESAAQKAPMLAEKKKKKLAKGQSDDSRQKTLKEMLMGVQ